MIVFKYLKNFKKIVMITLAIMMSIVLLLSTIELGWILYKDIVNPPLFLLDIGELLELFGIFMLVIIGIELLDTIIKTYLSESVDHVQVVMAVAIIAIARKVIILDVKGMPDIVLIGYGIIIISLSAGYYLIKKNYKKE